MIGEDLRIQPEEFMHQIPPELTLKHSHSSKTGFATVLWKFLEWADNEYRKANLGMAWVSNEEFLIDKKRFCSVTNTPLNTLNCKLRSFQFVQSRRRQNSISFYKCDLFHRNSTPEDLKQIDQRKNPNEDSQNIMPQAMFLPLLVSVRLHTTKPSEISYFKSESVILWQEIIGRQSIWSIDRLEFINSAADRFCQSFRISPDINTPSSLPSHSQFQGTSGNFFVPTSDTNGNFPASNALNDANSSIDTDTLGGFNAQQTEFAQYIAANNLDIEMTARQMISYVLPTKQPVVTLLDFCMFYARFGSEEYVLEKIHQLLCCSKSYGDWFQPGEQVFDNSKSMSGSYSNTFANCFIIKRLQKLTYHIYNLINASTRSGFLIDETGKKFHTWHAVFEPLSVPAQQISYGLYDQNYSIIGY